MAFTRFLTAQLDGSGGVTVTGPMEFSPDEQATMEVTSLHFVLVQGDVFVPGAVSSVRGAGSWAGTADLADELQPGAAMGHGVALMVQRAQEAAGGKPATQPVVQTLSWSEPITIT